MIGTDNTMERYVQKWMFMVKGSNSCEVASKYTLEENTFIEY